MFIYYWFTAFLTDGENMTKNSGTQGRQLIRDSVGTAITISAGYILSIWNTIGRSTASQIRNLVAKELHAENSARVTESLY